MADVDYKNFYERVGNGTANALERVADVAAGVVCDLYSGYTAFMRGGDSTDARGRGMDGLFDSLCNPRPDYTPPAPPPIPGFPGGKCPILYEVTACYVRNGEQKGVSTSFKYGPLGPFYQIGTSPGASAVGFYSRNSSTGALVRNDQFSGGNDIISQDSITARILSAVPVGGASDNCGQIGPQYQPTLPPPGDLAPVKPIPFPGGPISLPVTIVPVILRPEINFRPEINVDVGGIEIKFDLGGVTFNFPPPGADYPRLPPSPDPRPSPPQPTQPAPNPVKPDADTSKKIDKLIDDVEALEECACDDEGDRPVLTQAYASAQSRVITLPVRTKAVTVTITQQPNNAKRQEGVDATDVLYAGWAWFRGYGGLGPRLPLDAIQKTFYPPDSEKQTQFEYTAYNGHSASVVVTYLGDLP